MPRRPRIWALDTSILVSYFRSGRRRRFISSGLASGTIRLPGVVLCELYAAATSREDRTDLETLRRAFGRHVLGVTTAQWALAGRCLALYSARWGRIRPRDHLADILIAVTAADIGAAVASDNLEDLRRWVRILERFGYALRVETPGET